jgi:radical SAM protein with 4Fe4S-binding SPASM domain
MLPTTFWLVTNYHCNNRCKFCYAADFCCSTTEISSDMEFMDFNYAKNVLTEMKNIGAENCLLIGGEPTVYPYLFDIIGFGTAIGLKMKLVSNGRKLSNYNFVLSLKKAGLIHSSVSLEASDEKTHNSITQTDSFLESLEGAKNLIRAGISSNSIMTISSLNSEHIIPLAKMMHGIGMKNILYNFSLPSVESESISNSYSLDPREYADLISSAYYYLKSINIKIGFFATLPLCLFKEETLEEMKADQTIGRDYYCHIYYGTGAVFEPNGNVLPCTHFVNNPLFNGKGDDGKFSYIGKFANEWENGIHKDFVKEAWHYPINACNGCKHWGKCFGGCPFIWMKYKPDNYL